MSAKCFLFLPFVSCYMIYTWNLHIIYMVYVIYRVRRWHFQKQLYLYLHVQRSKSAEKIQIWQKSWEQVSSAELVEITFYNSVLVGRNLSACFLLAVTLLSDSCLWEKLVFDGFSNSLSRKHLLDTTRTLHCTGGKYSKIFPFLFDKRTVCNCKKKLYIMCFSGVASYLEKI